MTTELELRQKVLGVMRGWLGKRESDGSFREIVDLYNTLSPRPRGYKVRYEDEWCAVTVTAAGMKAGLGDIILPECSCWYMMEAYKAEGRFYPAGDYVPHEGDIVLFDWGGKRRDPNHVGFVDHVSERVDWLNTLEGNKNSEAGGRTIQQTSAYVMGYCVPDYAGMAEELNREERKNGMKLEECVKLYKYAAEVPEWARPTVVKAIRNGYIKMDETGAMGVWEFNLQTLVWMDRAGMLDARAGEEGQ